MFNALTNTNAGVEGARRAHLLVYDIPTGRMQNPSAMLWRFGVRINMSCWLIPDSRVALIPVKEWEAKGVKVELVRFDERDGETIIRLAREGLLNECARWREVLDTATNGVSELCSSVASVGEDQRAVAGKAGNLASFHLRRARAFAVAARECALGFDLLGDVEQVFNGLRDCIAAKEALFYAMVTDAKKRSTSSVPASSGTPMDVEAAFSSGEEQ